MHNALDAGHLADFPPHVVFQALLANNLTSFTEFAFRVVRPGVPFKPNWHFEAVTEKLSQVACGDIRRLIITLPPRTLKSLCARWLCQPGSSDAIHRNAWLLCRTRTFWRVPMPMTS